MCCVCVKYTIPCLFTGTFYQGEEETIWFKFSWGQNDHYIYEYIYMYIFVYIHFLFLHGLKCVFVLSRFCLSETSCPQEDNYPNSLCIKVNGKLFPLPVSAFCLFLFLSFSKTSNGLLLELKCSTRKKLTDWFWFMQGYAPPPKNGVEQKRPGRPLNITSLVRLSSAVPNQISVTWAPEIGKVSSETKLSSDAFQWQWQ